MSRWVVGGLISRADGPGFGKTQTRQDPPAGGPSSGQRCQDERTGDTSQSCVGHRVPLERPKVSQTSNGPGVTVSSCTTLIRHSDESTHTRASRPQGSCPPAFRLVHHPSPRSLWTNATGRSVAAIVPQIFADIRRGWEHRGQGGESCETGAAGMTWRASRRSAQLMIMPISHIMSS